MSIASLTDELVEALRTEIISALQEHLYWSQTTPAKQYAEDLAGLK
jgi:hypothetical protein